MHVVGDRHVEPRQAMGGGWRIEERNRRSDGTWMRRYWTGGAWSRRSLEAYRYDNKTQAMQDLQKAAEAR